jgi:hypothetical protein
LTFKRITIEEEHKVNQDETLNSRRTLVQDVPFGSRTDQQTRQFTRRSRMTAKLESIYTPTTSNLACLQEQIHQEEVTEELSLTEKWVLSQWQLLPTTYIPGMTIEKRYQLIQESIFQELIWQQQQAQVRYWTRSRIFENAQPEN